MWRSCRTLRHRPYNNKTDICIPYSFWRWRIVDIPDLCISHSKKSNLIKKKMIITTTNNIEGKQIATYLGIVTGEIALCVRLKTFFKRQDPEKKNRSSAYEDALFEAKQIALKQMEERAAKLGANAIIGIGFEINVTAADSYIMVFVSGTAVKAY